MAARRKSAPPQMPSGEPMPKVGPVKNCTAHGCPLAGTWSDQIYETKDNPAPWWCFIHSTYREYDYQALTHAIRSRQDLLDEYAAAHAAHDKPAFMKARGKIITAVIAAMRPREPGADDA